MMTMKFYFVSFLSLVCFSILQPVEAQIIVHPNPWKPTDSQRREMEVMMTNFPPSLAWRAAIIQKMMMEANFAANRLHLSGHHPIQIGDIADSYVAPPWTSIIYELHPPYLPVNAYGSNIYNSNIALKKRLQALEFGPTGRIDTTNLDFGFLNGRLCGIMRLSAPQVERYAHNLGSLIGEPSLINKMQAYELATQWLAAIDVNMKAISKLKWTIHQLHYKARGSTNYVTLPLYYLHFGNIHYPAKNNLKAFNVPQISVEILGTTKELQNLNIHDLSLIHRPPLLITNVLDLVHTPNPPENNLKRLSDMHSNVSSAKFK